MQENWSAMLSSVAEVNQKAVAATTAFNRIATRAQTRVARRQLAAFEDVLDAGSRHLAVATGGEAAQEAMTHHAEIAAQLGEKLVAAAQETLEIQVQARDELAKWFEEGVEVMKKEATRATAQVTPAATAPKARRTTRKSA